MSQGHSFRTHEEILDGIRREDPLAFEALFELYADLVYGFCRRLVADEATARRILTSAFVDALGEIREARTEQAVERDLLRAAAHGVMSARGVPVDGSGFEEIPLPQLYPDAAGGSGGSAHDWSVDPDEESRRADEKGALRELLAEMPPQYGVILVLFDMEEMSLQDIADIMNISVPSARKRLHQARMLLRRELTRRVLGGGSGPAETVQ